MADSLHSEEPEEARRKVLETILHDDHARHNCG